MTLKVDGYSGRSSAFHDCYLRHPSAVVISITCNLDSQGIGKFKLLKSQGANVLSAARS